MKPQLKIISATILVVAIGLVMIGAGCQGPGNVLDHPAVPGDKTVNNLLPETLAGRSLANLETDEEFNVATGDYGDFYVGAFWYDSADQALAAVNGAITETEDCSNCVRSTVSAGNKAYLKYRGAPLLGITVGLAGSEDTLIWNNGNWLFTIINNTDSTDLVEQVAEDFPY